MNRYQIRREAKLLTQQRVGSHTYLVGDQITPRMPAITSFATGRVSDGLRGIFDVGSTLHLE